MTIPFVCVLIALLLIYASRVPAAIAMKRQGAYNNNTPRDQAASLEGWGRRAYAAHLNSVEAFPPFAAGVVICYLAKGSLTGATVLSLVFIAARIAYPILYIADLATYRSSVWGIGLLATIGLYILPWLS